MEGSARNVGRNLVLALTLTIVLAAVVFSTGLVVHTAWNHDLNNGPFALAFAVLSARTALSWVSWSAQVSSRQEIAASYQHERMKRKSAGQATL
ncbi:MAG: hypothetical protein AVDCRST_MAG28-725 [uncultured Rubrobacteraceae bacterium]|uniref:Uncharacterized protein n=1 Tax=uncultured Rubrobacteraceae bacterium TaxID=349277 RepID=A0A6J4QFC8_9ACTN|nr:MAG: hypothetical protein AVDCRST_MAG28-725 [uncultured Rubrobacteraceae bacterium]